MCSCFCAQVATVVGWWLQLRRAPSLESGAGSLRISSTPPLSDLAEGRAKSVSLPLSSPFSVSSPFFILAGSGGRRSWCTAAAAARREASSLLQFSLSLCSSPAAGVALVSSHLHVASRLPLSPFVLTCRAPDRPLLLQLYSVASAQAAGARGRFGAALGLQSRRPSPLIWTGGSGSFRQLFLLCLGLFRLLRVLHR